jgi:hypothetical protein
MSEFELYQQYQSLPEHLKKEVENFIAFLKLKTPEVKKKKTRKFGSMKGKIVLAKDFDAPLADFKEYM